MIHTIYCRFIYVLYTFYIRFYSNSIRFASELLENFQEIFPWYYIDNDIPSMLKSVTTRPRAIRVSKSSMVIEVYHVLWYSNMWYIDVLNYSGIPLHTPHNTPAPPSLSPPYNSVLYYRLIQSTDYLFRLNGTTYHC